MACYGMLSGRCFNLYISRMNIRLRQLKKFMLAFTDPAFIKIGQIDLCLDRKKVLDSDKRFNSYSVIVEYLCLSGDRESERLHAAASISGKRGFTKVFESRFTADHSNTADTCTAFRFPRCFKLANIRTRTGGTWRSGNHVKLDAFLTYAFPSIHGFVMFVIILTVGTSRCPYRFAATPLRPISIVLLPLFLLLFLLLTWFITERVIQPNGSYNRTGHPKIHQKARKLSQQLPYIIFLNLKKYLYYSTSSSH